MKTFITAVLFAVFFSISALITEYSMTFMKHQLKNDTTLSQRMSFFYGWVNYKGEKHFFVQQGYYTHDCDEQALEKITLKVRKELKSALSDKFGKVNIVKLEGAGCFEDIKTLNNQKKKLLQDKTKVIQLPI